MKVITKITEEDLFSVTGLDYLRFTSLSYCVCFCLCDKQNETIYIKRSLSNYTNASLSEVFVGVVWESLEIFELLDRPEPMYDAYCPAGL